MYALKFTDETFDSTSCQDYILSIRLSLGGFSFSIYDVVRRKFVILRSVQLEASSTFHLIDSLHKIFDADTLLSNDYKRTIVSWCDAKFTISPFDITQGGDASKVLQLTSGLTRNDQVSYELFDNCTAVYAFPNDVASFLSNKIKGWKPVFPYRHFLSDTIHIKGSNIFCSYENGHMVLAIKSDGQLKYINSYQSFHLEDIVYYIMSVYKTYEIDPKDIPIYIYGNMATPAKLLSTLKRYIKHVSLAKKQANCLTSYTFDTAEDHMYLELLEQLLCEL